MEVSTAINSSQATSNANNNQLVGHTDDQQVHKATQQLQSINTTTTTIGKTATIVSENGNSNATATVNNTTNHKSNNNNNIVHHSSKTSSQVNNCQPQCGDINNYEADEVEGDVHLIMKLLKDAVEADSQQQQPQPQKQDQNDCSSKEESQDQTLAVGDSIADTSIDSQETQITTPSKDNQIEPISISMLDVGTAETVPVADFAPGETKEMALLKNLEISPPPQPTAAASLNPPTAVPATTGAIEDVTVAKSDGNDDESTREASTSKKKRSRADLTPEPEVKTETETEQQSTSGRNKRQRTQTQLFQAGGGRLSADSYSVSSPDSPSPCKTTKTTKATSRSTSKKKKSTIPKDHSRNSIRNDLPHTAQDTVPVNHEQTTNDLAQDVIFYEKDDYLAIRNEENSFYLCKLTENVRVLRPMIKVRWLDTDNDGKTYFLTSHYDKVPQKSIIMPVSPNKIKGTKKNEQLFTLDDEDKIAIMDRLKRSLTIAPQVNSSQESTA